MSHVDEGTLHAYLDGALDDVLPSAEAARVREHLASCEACAARLGEEREVREEAAEILNSVGPAISGLGEVAPFEELRSRAARRAARPEGVGRRLQSLGWAASIVVAVGAGWMLRGASVPDVVQQRPLPEPVATEEREAPAEAPLGRVAGAADADDADAAAAGSVAGAGGQEAGPSGSSPTPAASARPDVAAARTPATTPAEPPAAPPSRDLGAPPVPDVRESGARVAQVGAEPGLADLTSVSPPAPARLDTLAFPRTAVEANRVLEERAAPAVSGLRPSEPGRPGAEFQARQRAVRDARDRISSMERPESKAVAGFADARLSGSLVVPGLQVLAVLALDADGIPGGVRVRQLLEDGDTLEMVHLPPGIEPSVLAPVGDGRTELVLPRAGGWLVVRAAADRQEMLRWVERLGGGG